MKHPANKQIVVAVLVLSFFLAVRDNAQFAADSAQASVLYGDVNADGRLDVFDLLALLREMKAEQPIPAANLDGNGKVDIFDLLKLLEEFTFQRESRRVPFEGLVILDHYVLAGERIYTTSHFEYQNDISFTYQIISSRTLNRVEFVLGRDSLRDVSGTTPILLSADQDTLPRDFSSLDAMYTFTKPLDWYLKIWDMNGELFADSGQISIGAMNFQFTDFGGSPNFGKPIEFPLVLRGKSQKFGILLPRFENMINEREGVYTVELNPEALDSVVYESVDQIVETIMPQLVANDRLWNDPGYWGEGIVHTYVSAAVARATGEKTNRLCVATYGYFGTGYTKVVAIGDNQTLLNDLGFPLWLRRTEMYDMNYVLDPEVYGAYRDR